MPLIQADSKGKKVALTVELDRKTNTTLKKYLRYSGADTDKVVAGALQQPEERVVQRGDGLFDAGRDRR